MLPEAVLVRITLLVMTAMSPNVWLPVVVTLPLRLTNPGPSVVRFANAPELPTVELNRVAPAVLTVSECVPAAASLTVLMNVTLPLAPAPVLVSRTLFVSSTASLKS